MMYLLHTSLNTMTANYLTFHFTQSEGAKVRVSYFTFITLLFISQTPQFCNSRPTLRLHSAAVHQSTGPCSPARHVMLLTHHCGELQGSV